MSLAVGLNAARSGLALASDAIALVSRNVANSGNTSATRKVANIVSDSGGARLAGVSRVADSALAQSAWQASSAVGLQQAKLDALTQLDAIYGDATQEQSPGALIGKLESALRTAAANPADTSSANAVVAAAKSVASALKTGADQVAKVRQGAEDAMASSVSTVNQLLKQLEVVNTTIVRGQGGSTDLTDELDQRDALIGQVAQEIGVRTQIGSDGGISLYTDSGITLFDGKARSVSFSHTDALAASDNGGAVYIDGVPAIGANSIMAVKSGRLVGLAAVRDQIAPTYQAQLDETARGLVASFAETDQSGGAQPALPGLFTFDGATGVPAAGTLVNGLSALISVNPTVDSSVGGDPLLLRDGGVSGTGSSDYIYNTSGDSGFSERLSGLVTSLNAKQPFDAVANSGGDVSIIDFATNATAWLAGERQLSSSDLDYQTAKSQHATQALAQATSVNLDVEMTNMLQLERSYQASSRMIATIDQMLASLLTTLG